MKPSKPDAANGSEATTSGSEAATAPDAPEEPWPLQAYPKAQAAIYNETTGALYGGIVWLLRVILLVAVITSITLSYLAEDHRFPQFLWLELFGVSAIFAVVPFVHRLNNNGLRYSFGVLVVCAILCFIASRTHGPTTHVLLELSIGVGSLVILDHWFRQIYSSAKKEAIERPQQAEELRDQAQGLDPRGKLSGL